MAALTGSLTKEQKIGFGLLLVFAFLSIGLGILQIRNTMYGPLSLNSKPPVDIKNQVAGVDALRYRDTDYDGLNDFDELYVYGTSPYLADTFSYGMSDKEVVEKGLPLCPKGQDCGTPSAGASTQISASASSTAAALQAQLGTPPPDLLATLRDQAQIRKMLRESGLDPKVLENVSDSQLLLLSNQILMDTSTVEKIKQVQQAASLPNSAPATSTNR
jgi:hypothetical protein